MAWDWSREAWAIAAVAFVLTLSCPGGLSAAAETGGADPFWTGAWNFDREQPGGPPAGFTAAVLGGGSAAAWTIEADPHAPGPPNVLLQADACAAPDCWRLLLLNERDFDYVDLAVVLRVLSGGPQSGAGLVLAAKDAENFHAIVVDAAMETLEVLRVRGGQKTILGRQTLKKSKNLWHGLRVEKINTAKLNKPYLEIGFDGTLVLSVTDEALVPGKIGLLTRGDAVAAFDTLRAMQLFSNVPLSKPPAY
ncbi:hypothetical protein [Nitrospira sp. Kam-Ns4a]